jgi:MoaA/NifB/PqqE/SkfB family radical SAM enzyme
MFYHFLALIYTMKCTSSCKVCGFSCSPKREEKMKYEDALRYINEAKDAGIKVLGITGGEPFLFKDEVLKLCEHAVNRGMKVTLTTNCFWAYNKENTFDVMRKLKEIGVNRFKISCDEFHNEEISYENIKNVLRVAQELDMSVLIGCTVIKTGKRLKDILENIQDEALGTNFLEQACHPLGRAAKEFEEDEFLYHNNIPTGCSEKGVITIMPDGKVYPCGSMCGMIKNREIGSAIDKPIKFLIEKAKNNGHNHLLYNYGIKTYYDYLEGNKSDIVVNSNKKFIDGCHACYLLFNNNDINKLNEIADIIKDNIRE